MVTKRHRHLYWTTNLEELFGFPPGTLLISRYESGGGFAGAPEVLTVSLVSGMAPDSPKPEQAEWPQPSNNVDYRVGGRMFSGWVYYDPKYDD